MSNAEIVYSSLSESKKVLDIFLSDAENVNRIVQAAELMAEAVRAGGKIISCGNGGSMCDAMHFAEEMTGRFRDDRKPLPAISISDPSHISCVANDFGFDFVFSRFVEAHGTKGDVLLAISTSGKSKNVMLAIEAAKKKGMSVVGLTGKTGGNMAESVDVEIRAPQSDYADRAQEIHIKVIHALIHCIEHSLK